MPTNMVRSALVCVAMLSVASQSFRIGDSSAKSAKTDGIHGGPPTWWRTLTGIARQLGVQTAKATALDIGAYFSNAEAHERMRDGKPSLDDSTQEHYKAFLRELGRVAIKIEKLKRLQAGCDAPGGPSDADDEYAGEFSRQSFEAVAKLGKEFPEPRDIFSLMPENAAEAKKKWIYEYSSPNAEDLMTSHKDFLAWQKKRGLKFGDVDKAKMLFDGLHAPEFQKRNPSPDLVEFPVDIMYVQKTETFDLDMIDAVMEDWAAIAEHPVSRDAYVNHFLSKPAAKQLPGFGDQLLKQALEAAFDACTQMTMPTATQLDEHAFRYCSVLAFEMFLNNIPSDEC